MKSTDYRNNTWEELKAKVSGLRMEVYTAFVRFGPGTTWQISDKAKLSILTLRPRTTELLQMGFVEVMDGTDNSREATYIAIPEAMVKERFEWLKAQPVQKEFPLEFPH